MRGAAGSRRGSKALWSAPGTSWSRRRAAARRRRRRPPRRLRRCIATPVVVAAVAAAVVVAAARGERGREHGRRGRASDALRIGRWYTSDVAAAWFAAPVSSSLPDAPVLPAVLAAAALRRPLRRGPRIRRRRGEELPQPGPFWPRRWAAAAERRGAGPHRRGISPARSPRARLRRRRHVSGALSLALGRTYYDNTRPAADMLQPGSLHSARSASARWFEGRLPLGRFAPVAGAGAYLDRMSATARGSALGIRVDYFETTDIAVGVEARAGFDVRVHDAVELGLRAGWHASRADLAELTDGNEWLSGPWLEVRATFDASGFRMATGSASAVDSLDSERRAIRAWSLAHHGDDGAQPARYLRTVTTLALKPASATTSISASSRALTPRDQADLTARVSRGHAPAMAPIRRCSLASITAPAAWPASPQLGGVVRAPARARAARCSLEGGLDALPQVAGAASASTAFSCAWSNSRVAAVTNSRSLLRSACRPLARHARRPGHVLHRDAVQAVAEKTRWRRRGSRRSGRDRRARAMPRGRHLPGLLPSHARSSYPRRSAMYNGAARVVGDGPVRARPTARFTS